MVSLIVCPPSTCRRSPGYSVVLTLYFILLVIPVVHTLYKNSLHWIARFDRMLLLIFLRTLTHGGDISARDHTGRTALHWSAVRGAVQVAELMLQEGARVSAADHNGYEVIAGCLSEEEIMGLKEMFKGIDSDNSGTITLEELKQELPKQGTKLSEVEAKQADADENGMIDYEKFITATMHMNRMDREEHLYTLSYLLLHE